MYGMRSSANVSRSSSEGSGPLQVTTPTEPAIDHQDAAMVSLLQALAQGDLPVIEVATQHALLAGLAEINFGSREFVSRSKIFLYNDQI